MKTRILAVILSLLATSLTAREAVAAPITSFAAFQAAADPLTTVTFEDLIGGAIITGNEYAGAGLTIVQRDGQPIRVAFLGDGSFMSTQNVNSGTRALSSSAVPSGYDNSKSENYDFTLGSLASSAGLWIGNFNPGFNPVSVQFLGEGNAVLGSINLTTADPNLVTGVGQFDNRLFVGLNSSAGIRTIRVSNPVADIDGLVFDDVSFALIPPPPPPDPDPSPVPEPGALTLLAIGVVTLTTSGARRRGHRS